MTICEYFGQTNSGPAVERAADMDELSDAALAECPEPLRSQLLADREAERKRRGQGTNAV
jgi:hypothetical protein